MYGQTINVLLGIKEMDKRFLNKVVDQIVRETTIDYENDRIFTHFYTPTPLSLPFNYFPDFNPFIRLFRRHCKNVYGLNEVEKTWVWNEYKKIIKDKIDG